MTRGAPPGAVTIDFRPRLHSLQTLKHAAVVFLYTAREYGVLIFVLPVYYIFFYGA